MTRALGNLLELQCSVRHYVQRIRHHDQNGLGRELHHGIDNPFDHIVVRFQQVVTAHAGFARESCGDDDDVAIFRAGVIAGRGGDACCFAVGIQDGTRLRHIQGFAGGHAV